ncbi:DUF5955 family protein [Actinomadura livida]|uniref:Enamine deaminase RidA (YjgF/YER057c/UK114 family) n=1 Tax=Actinomadura livida TaxID=79909 RepID=A0A7W7I974_9ACTN|nr:MULTISPECIES: DUF5955 family protein [Actinomadura]MBB4772839.1 enamine deaminase RidA (YjgF/YER057c/UK114 family) [Actinomadura catellatispora]GGU13096.1 hypothetical protein GCM10010208_42540 [Actinomadura livida]
MTGHGERGVSIGGSANVSGQIATGDNVTQNQQINAGPAPDVAEALANVERLLEAHAAELDEPGRARRDLADIREEAESGDADPERMEGALVRLGRRVAGVAVLTEAVQQLAVTAGIG